MKRLFDVVVSLFGLLCVAPLLLPVMALIWAQDWHSPFYVATRVGEGGRDFLMVKLRSMIVNADQSGVDSTGASDRRITPIGQFVRRYKLDEIAQLWNVLKGDMSVVGPRPNVRRETDLYTGVERRLLDVKPGITDIASIVFADEGEILKDAADPDIAYNQLIRPGKSRLALFWLDHRSLLVDLQLCWLTAVTVVSRPAALASLERMLSRLGAPKDLVDLSRRDAPLVPMPPPGATDIVTSRA